MRLSSLSCRPAALLSVLAAVLVALSVVRPAQAQFELKWLAVGEMHKYYTEAGSHNEDYQGHNIHWPGIRNEHGNVRGYALWFAATNFVDENGMEWPVKVAHVGPRVTGLGEVFPEAFVLRGKFDLPVVKVDGFETFNRPVVVEEVDPAQKFDHTIYSRTATVLGVTEERWASQFSQEYHDNYHVIEFVFTNTGNVDNDEAIELPDQTLEGVYFYFQNRYAPNRSAGWEQNNAQGWGKWTMNDTVGDGHEDYNVPYRAQYSWLGHVPSRQDYTTLGGPLWNDGLWLVASGDSTGRLGAAHMMGRVILHADKSTVDKSDDPEQPRTMNFVWTGDPRTHLNEHTDIGKNQFEYELITEGRVYPHHADLVEPAGDFANPTGDPVLGRGGDGFAFAEGFGPYTMGPGESIRVVLAEGIAGISDEAAVHVGQTYKRNQANDDLIIEFDANGDGVIDPTPFDYTVKDGGGEAMTKNEWAISAKDSILQVFDRAVAAYEANWDIPQPPNPPATFEVTSQTDRISIAWSAMGSAPSGGWELYRAQNRFDGLPLDPLNGADFADWPTVYKLVGSFDGGTTSYEDTDVIRGVDYYYYLQAVGAVNNNGAGLTPTGVPLKSNRYYAQTYDPARLKRPPGASLADARVVPNPININTDQNLLFSNRDLLFFFDIPGRCTIKIYTEMGELIRELEHLDGSGDHPWDLQTTSLQLVATGIYLAVIEDLDTGEQVVRKFTVIR